MNSSSNLVARKRSLPRPALVVQGPIAPPEKRDERLSRLRREEAEASHKRAKDWAILGASFVVTGITLIVAIAILAWSGDATTRGWATTIISTTLAGYLGYWSGSKLQSR